MKQIITTFIFLFIVTSLFAQTPQAFNYQGVARDLSGNPIPNQNIGLQVAILQGSPSGTEIYKETHDVTTNNIGLFKAQIGKGIVGNGTFANINWGADDHYLQIEMDENGGNNYQLIGTNQLLSVPYALHSERVNEENLPRTKITSLALPDCENIPPTDNWQKLTDLGTFSKSKASTFIDLDFQTHFYATSVTNAVIYQLRVNNNITTIGKAAYIYHSTVTNQYINGHITGTFDGLDEGTHTISLWVRTRNGTAGTAFIDPGCYTDTNSLIVKEYR